MRIGEKAAKVLKTKIRNGVSFRNNLMLEFFLGNKGSVGFALAWKEMMTLALSGCILVFAGVLPNGYV